MINMLVYVSPIVFPSLLFNKYKDMFNAWLKNLMGYSLQLVFVVVFGGLFIINLEKIGLGDAKYINHDPLTGRLPVIDCDDVDGTSLICLFNISTDKGETPLLGTPVKKILGLGPVIGVIKSLNQDFVGTVITLLKSCLILYVLLQFMKSMDKIILEITGTVAFDGGHFGDDRKSFIENLKKPIENVKTGARIARYTGNAPIDKVKGVNSFVKDKMKTLRDLHGSGGDKKDDKFDKSGKDNGSGTIGLQQQKGDRGSTSSHAQLGVSDKASRDGKKVGGKIGVAKGSDETA